MAEETKNTSRSVLYVLLALVAILVVVALARPSGEKVEVGADDDVDANTGDETTLSTNFTYMVRDDWDGFARAQRNIQSLGEGQSIEFGIVSDPDQENIVYFASSAYNSEAQENLISIYRYNEDDYHFERIFRRTYKQGDFSLLDTTNTDPYLIPVFHVLGYDQGKLVILAQFIDDSPGPCANVWAYDDFKARDANETIWHDYVTLDLENPYGGFEQYDVPEEVESAGREAEEECLVEFAGWE